MKLGEMLQQGKVFAIKSKDLSSIPRTHRWKEVTNPLNCLNTHTHLSLCLPLSRWQDGSVGRGACIKPDDLSSIPGTTG